MRLVLFPPMHFHRGSDGANISSLTKKGDREKERTRQIRALLGPGGLKPIWPLVRSLLRRSACRRMCASAHRHDETAPSSRPPPSPSFVGGWPGAADWGRRGRGSSHVAGGGVGGPTPKQGQLAIHPLGLTFAICAMGQTEAPGVRRKGPDGGQQAHLEAKGKYRLHLAAGYDYFRPSGRSTSCGVGLMKAEPRRTAHPGNSPRTCPTGTLAQDGPAGRYHTGRYSLVPSLAPPMPQDYYFYILFISALPAGCNRATSGHPSVLVE